jgi:hypothetical protein
MKRPTNSKVAWYGAGAVTMMRVGVFASWQAGSKLVNGS